MSSHIKKLWRFLLLTMMLVGNVYADEHTAATAEALQKLKENFIDLPVSDFGPGPLAGSYEFVSNGTLLYYFPVRNLLFVGEFFTREGRSITADRLIAIQAKKQHDLPLELALKIGNGEKKIIEFTDPECPFCQSYHDYIRTHAAEVTRYVFFIPIRNLHPTAPAKAIHVLCANDKQQAFADVYEHRIGMMDLKECEEGKALLAKQEAIARNFGVNSTPTLILGEGQLVRGFDKAAIEAFLGAK